MKLFITNRDFLESLSYDAKIVHKKLFDIITSHSAIGNVPLNPIIDDSILFELKGLKSNVYYYEFLGNV